MQLEALLGHALAGQGRLVAVAVGTGAVAGMAADKFVAELEGRAYPERGTT